MKIFGDVHARTGLLALYSSEKVTENFRTANYLVCLNVLQRKKQNEGKFKGGNLRGIKFKSIVGGRRLHGSGNLCHVILALRYIIINHRNTQ